MCKLQENSPWFMDFQVKMQKNSRENIFRDNQKTNKVALIILDIKVLTER